MASESTKLVLGRGEVYFAPFNDDLIADSGEIYIGNTPEFVTSREVETEDRYDSFDGQKIKVDGAIVRENHSARFTTDHMALENLTLWYGQDTTDVIIQNRAVNLQEQFVVRRGRYYQIGVTPSLPMGARGVESVKFFVDGVEVPAAGNFEVDFRFARFQVLADAPGLTDGSIIDVEYERRDISSSVVQSSKRELFGSLRYVSRNPIGPQKNYFYPFVKLSAAGEIDHKATDWQTLSFEVEVQRRNPLFEYVYIDEIEVFGRTVLEFAIEELSGITFSEFPFWENRLDIITNTRMPAHNY